MDIVSAEPLFASIHKFDSGSRWPSFTVALEPGNVAEMADRKLGMLRTEVRSSHGRVTSVMSSMMGRQKTVACATASIRPPCASCPTEKLEAQGY